MALNFESLLEKFLKDELTEEELKVFLENGNTPVNQDILYRVLGEKLHQQAYQGLSMPDNTARSFQQMLEKAETLESPPAVIIPMFRKNTYLKYIRIAAVLVLAISVTAYLFNSRTASVTQQQSMADLNADKIPGGNKAILTLSNGAKIILDSAANGVLARQGNTNIIKLTNGQLAYQPKGSNTAGEILYNTMTTPRGGQYKLALPDGTLVWLNAASSIYYPTMFSGKAREVEITGEAYFEVMHDTKMPFCVRANGAVVNVLGTHFNVNAYGDESSTKITLLAGAVKVRKGLANTLLSPGQQAQITGNSEIKLSNDVDVEEVVAWKNGLFWFNGVDLPGIMRQLSRWYDIDVAYEGDIPPRHFTGHVFRYLNLSEVLKILELSHVHFRIEGKKLIVTP